MSLMNCKVLVVEDTDQLRTLLVETLQSNKITVVSAADGFEALKHIESETFDVILTDLDLPKIDGKQLAVLAKSAQRNHATPVIILSGMADTSILGAAREHNIATILAKPCSPNLILAAISDAIGKDHGTSVFSPTIISCFSTALQELLAEFSGETITPAKFQSNSGALTACYVSGLVPLSGTEQTGHVMITIDQKTAIHMSRSMIGTELGPETDGLVADVVGELCNQLAGRVKLNLKKEGINVMVELPHVVLGLGHKIFRKPNGPTSRINCSVNGSTVFFEFSLVPVNHPSRLGRVA